LTLPGSSGLVVFSEIEEKLAITDLPQLPHDTLEDGLEDEPTLFAPGKTAHALATAATVVADPPPGASFEPPSATRTTVLPRVEGEGAAVRLEIESRTRYEPVKLLGAGGMGEVVLVEDQDIARKVAIKRLLPELNDATVIARFVDEIRTVGRLEHPNIVPIHDVGVDELGRYFFVMKYVEGETLESIIEKLAAGDPAYLAKYTYERRIEIFIGLLHALEYSHAQGVVHRDVKPANVMVGRFGEVVLMDWGVAKPVASKRDPAANAEGALGGGEGERARMFATRVGALIGTPAYMAPEQARGENHRLDARCDLYSAAVLFHELIAVRHYLDDATSLDGMIAAVATKEIGWYQLLTHHHARHPQPPAELIHFVAKGMAKDPDKRFQSAREMIDELESVLAGKVKVQCHATMTKRVAREMGRFVDAHPHVSFGLLVTFVLGILGGAGFAGIQLVRALLA
jgi:serine/threonine-protein kinase